jgi:hypothetical protein
MISMIKALGETINAMNGINSSSLNIDYEGGNEHVWSTTNKWTLSMWKEDDVQLTGTKIIDQVEKLEYELANDIINNKHTTVSPIQMVCTDNIITNIGLTESAKRDTDEVSTSLTHNSIGTGSTTPTVSDTDLVTEDTGGSYARLAYASAGQRKVVNQTSKFGVLWTDALVSAVPISITESGVHWASTGSSNIHARVTFTAFSMTSGDLFVTQINELHQNG